MSEILELAIKLEFFKRNLIKALNRLVEVEKERDELRKERDALAAELQLLKKAM